MSRATLRSGVAGAAVVATIVAFTCLARVPDAAASDAARGEQVYARCLGCHSLEADRTGPRHCGLSGRRAGTVPGFDYSPAMVASGITWNEGTLDRFLADPVGVVPGTRMTFAGVADATERRDLVAWLLAASVDPARCDRR